VGFGVGEPDPLGDVVKKSARCGGVTLYSNGTACGGAIVPTHLGLLVLGVSILPKPEPRPEKRRRSKRINARVPVAVHLLDPAKKPVTESTHTVVVNAHGALILLATPVERQAIIRIENTVNHEELLCRVAHVGPTFMGKTQVAVEFIKPSASFSQAAITAKRAEVLGANRP
jgi:hypothetical protein